MKKYVYADGYSHISEVLTAEEIKKDEVKHGDLQYMRVGSSRIMVDNRKKVVKVDAN